VKSRTRQRTDSTHVLAAVRDLNRLERVGETLHATLNVLAVAAAGWVRVNIPTEWDDRYGKRVDEWRLPEKEKDREIYIQMVGQDGAALLDAVWSEEAPGWMRSLPAVETLRRMWVQQFMGLWELPWDTPTSCDSEKEEETTDLTDWDGSGRINPWKSVFDPLNPWFLWEIELTTRCWWLSRQFQKSPLFPP
jgi:hypothetical protein